MSLLLELRNVMNGKKLERINEGKNNWPRIKDLLNTEALNLRNYLALNGNYYYLCGIKELAEQEGLSACITDENPEHNSTLTISW